MALEVSIVVNYHTHKLYYKGVVCLKGQAIPFVRSITSVALALTRELKTMSGMPVKTLSDVYLKRFIG